jgi:hypothetical protein
LVEVGTMISTIALGDVHDLLRRWLVTVIAPIDMKARAVEVHIGWTQVQTLGGSRRDETVEFGHPRVIEGIQGATERIIVELVGSDAGRNEALGGLILKEAGHQVERLIVNPRPLSTIALTASPTVRSRISGFYWVAWSMTSPMPSSSNMLATRPR